MVDDSAVRTMISPSRYVQARGALGRIGEYVAPLGSRALVVADDVVWGLVSDLVETSFRLADLPVSRTGFGVYATAAEVDRVAAAIADTGADVVIGVGGGSTLDVVKAAGTPAASGGCPRRPWRPRGAPTEEFRDFVGFTTRVGLPNTLTEVGLSTSDVDDLRRVAEAATAEGETIHNMPFPVRVTDLVDALRAIEGLSRGVRAELGLPEPVPHRAH